MFDIIPDIHGPAIKLEALLKDLGWRRTTAGWANDMPGRRSSSSAISSTEAQRTPP